MSDEPRTYTAEEAREHVLGHMHVLVKYWAKLPDKSMADRLDGLAFSFLTMIDGATGLPAMDLVLRPHHNDEEFHREEDENWYQDGQVVNGNVCLHELWY